MYICVYEKNAKNVVDGYRLRQCLVYQAVYCVKII